MTNDFFLPINVFDAPPAPVPNEVTLVLLSSVSKTHSEPKKRRFLINKQHRLVKILALVGIVLLLVSWGPSLVTRVLGEENRYRLNPETIPISSSSYQPPIDQNLPYENRIKIPSIKVDGLIYEAQKEDYEEALKKGVWRVSHYGTPYERNLPTIVAAHRYGYVSWSNIFRRKNSFYNLPKLAIGDTVEIYWRQRKYTYAIYAEGKGLEIEDYTADLILYTCEDLSSDIKLFKYARLLEI